MKRWFVALVATALACIPIYLNRATSPALLTDTDTKVLLQAIRARHAPLSWFTGDWPLANHFYRPVSTLTFEMDNRLYGDHAAGYGLTNAIVCIACVLLLFWFLRELTESPILAGGGAVLFAFQHYGSQYLLLPVINVLALSALVIGPFRHRLRLDRWLPAFLVFTYCAFEVVGLDSRGMGTIGPGTLNWLPGRTATVMTVFALGAMAAYARYERLTAFRFAEKMTPATPPATRGASVPSKPGRFDIIWPLLSILCIALALASYEQAVMLPACMLAVAVTMRNRRYQVRWGWQAAFWAVLFGYLELRHVLIPRGASAYQLQQFRSGDGVRISLLDYTVPSANELASFWVTLDLGIALLQTASPYGLALSIASNLTALYQCYRKWVFSLAGFGMSVIAFLPMAWVKPFPHYNYWPMALRSLFAVTLLVIGWDLVVIAWSPPTRIAPPRLDPAPGSLLHR